MSGHRQSALFLASASGALLVFFVVWAALHDLAHGDEGTVEGIFLAISAAAFALLYRFALRSLAYRARMVWLMGVAGIAAFFNVAAVSAILRPMFPRDPLLGACVLAAGVSLCAMIGIRLFRETRRRANAR